MLQIQSGNLFDFLSEFLVLEKNTLHLLNLARDRARDRDVMLDMQQALDQFVIAAERQIDRLQSAIRELGGNPVYVSPSGQIQYQRTRSVSQLQGPMSLQQLADIENCWYAALQENVHLAFLRSMLPFLKDETAPRVLTDLLDDASRVQESRLEWIEQIMQRLLLQRALAPVEGADISKIA
jgi:hypothetical protein